MSSAYERARNQVSAFAAALLAGCAYGAQPSPPSVAIEPGMQAQKSEAAPAKREFNAQVLSVDSGQIRLASDDAARREIVLQARPEIAEKLAQAKGRAFDTVALQHESPAGRAIALSLKDQRGLFAVAESIRDRPLLTPPDRGGIEVEQLTSGERTFVFDAPCATHYNVPTAFVIDDARIVLQPGETKDARVAGAEYTISLETSRFVVPKSCPAVFEGARREIDYAVVRK